MVKDQLIHVRISTDAHNELNQLIEEGEFKSMSHAVRSAVNYYLENRETLQNKVSQLDTQYDQITNQMDKLDFDVKEIKLELNEIIDVVFTAIEKLEQGTTIDSDQKKKIDELRNAAARAKLKKANQTQS